MSTEKDKYDDLQSRYNSLVAATLRQSDMLDELRKENSSLKAENARIGAELLATQMSAQMLGDEINSDNKAAGREVERLRGLCKEHGISPEN